MNIQEFSRNTRKGYIYNLYSNVIKTPKDYERISRKKMCLEILDYIQNNGLESLITYDEYESIMQLINNSFDDNKKTIYMKLANRMLVVYDFKIQKYIILDELKDIIQVKLLNMNIDRLEERKETDIIISGIIKSYGLLSLEHFKTCLNHYFHKDIFSSFINTDYFLQFYDYELLEYYDLILDKRFTYHFEDMMRAYQQFDNNFNNDYFIPVKSLKSISQYDIDLNKKNNKELYNKLQILPVYQKNSIIEKLLLYTHVHAVIDQNFLLNHSTYDDAYTDLLPLIKKAAKGIPCAIFHGLSEQQFLKKYKNMENKAKLSSKDAFLFFKIYFALLEYVNKKYHIQPQLKKIYQQTNMPPNLILPIRDYLFEHLDIIDDFIKENPYRLTDDELELIYHFKDSIGDIFIIMKYDKEYTYLLGRNANFAIKGLHSTIAEVIPAYNLPYACQMYLIPFKDVIVYDGIITQQISLEFSKNIIDSFNKDFNSNITYYTIGYHSTSCS